MRKNIKELDEELSSQIFNCPMAEVNEKVEKFIKDDFEESAFALRKIELFNELEKVLNFDSPQSIYDRECAYLYDQMKNNPESDELKDLSDEQLKENANKIALRRIRIGLMLTEYATLNKINVTDNDIRMGMLEKIKEFPAMANQIVQYYNTNKAALNSLIASVLENKAAKHIIENEVSSEEKEYSYDNLIEKLQKETDAVFKKSSK
jgi:trigger factor